MSSDLEHLAILGWVDCGIPSHELNEHFEDAGLTAVSWGLENPRMDRSVFFCSSGVYQSGSLRAVFYQLYAPFVCMEKKTMIELIGQGMEVA